MPTQRPLDSFARDNLPPREQWPVFLLDRPEFQYPERFNCAVTLLDDQVKAGHGQKPCILAPGTEWTYVDLLAQVNRVANVLVDQFGLAPGNRVLLRAPNNPMMAATYLAVIKAGGIVVATMPLLRAKELSYPIQKAEIALALCDGKLAEEMEKAKAAAPSLKRVVYWGTGSG